MSRASLILLSALMFAPTAHAEDTVTVTPSSAPSVTSVERPQTPVRTSSVGLDKEYFTGYWTDFRNMLTAPARWKTEDSVTALLVVGTTAGLYFNDEKIQKWTLDHKTATTERIGDDVTLVGSGYLTAAVVGGMYIYGIAGDDPKAVETVLLSMESFALTGVFVQTVKRGAGRRRPYTGDPYNTWTGPGLASSNDSFPSGHASAAFSVATVIALEYDNAVVPTLAYGIAAITGLNRIQHNAHWASDVFAGSAVGYFTGRAIFEAHRGGPKSRVTVVPLYEVDGPALALRWSF
jgi:hypothetical protein